MQSSIETECELSWIGKRTKKALALALSLNACKRIALTSHTKPAIIH